MSTTVRSREEVDLETHKALVRSFVEAWNTRDFDRFDALMGEGAVLHIGGGQVRCDSAGTRAIAEEWTSAFPDWRFELLRLVAEGTLVVAHMPTAARTAARSWASRRPAAPARSTRWSSSGSPTAGSPRPGRSMTTPACGANSEWRRPPDLRRRERNVVASGG